MLATDLADQAISMDGGMSFDDMDAMLAAFVGWCAQARMSSGQEEGDVFEHTVDLVIQGMTQKLEGSGHIVTRRVTEEEDNGDSDKDEGLGGDELAGRDAGRGLGI
jgi:N-acetylglutamate synthase/N-acetylornithine aminotransferase